LLQLPLPEDVKHPGEEETRRLFNVPVAIIRKSGGSSNDAASTLK